MSSSDRVKVAAAKAAGDEEKLMVVTNAGAATSAHQ